MSGDPNDVQAATDHVIDSAEQLASTLRHSARNLEMATELLLLLLSDQEQGHEPPTG